MTKFQWTGPIDHIQEDSGLINLSSNHNCFHIAIPITKAYTTNGMPTTTHGEAWVFSSQIFAFEVKSMII